MFIELSQYSGAEESRCPYCGTYMGIVSTKRKDQVYGSRVVHTGSFTCYCDKCSHYTFIDTTLENLHDECVWHKYTYVFATEWLNHQSIGDELNECSSYNEVYINQLAINEDELWQTQKHKEVYNPTLGRTEHRPERTSHNRRWLAEALLLKRQKKKSAIS